MKLNIHINNASDAVKITNICLNYKEDIDAICGRYIIDAKSILGLIGLANNKDIIIEIHTENENIKEKFLADMEEYIIK